MVVFDQMQNTALLVKYIQGAQAHVHQRWDVIDANRGNRFEIQTVNLPSQGRNLFQKCPGLI